MVNKLLKPGLLLGHILLYESVIISLLSLLEKFRYAFLKVPLNYGWIKYHANNLDRSSMLPLPEVLQA